jgi:hypothetical protein
MGLLDDVLSGLGGPSGSSRWLRHNLRAGERLLREGETASARITGIRVTPGQQDSPDDHEFALEHAGAGAATMRAGCRQDLGPFAREVRLGMEVPIRHDGAGKAIIDVNALGVEGADAWGYKPLGEPPEDGIVDANFRLEKERRKAVPARLTVLEAQPSVVLGMPTANVDLHVRVAPEAGEPYETVVERALVPFYATHLVAPGSEVLGVARRDRPDKVRIDWPASAVADPGIGRAPAAES